MNKLVINKGTFEIQKFDLNGGILTVGREKNCDIRLNDRTVSNQHAKFVTVMSTTYIEDMGSTNGVRVNGTRVRTHALHPDDIISIGSYDILYIQTTPPKYARQTIDDGTQIMDLNNMAQRVSKKTIAMARVGNGQKSASTGYGNQTHAQYDNKFELVVNNLTTQKRRELRSSESASHQFSRQATNPANRIGNDNKQRVKYYNKDKDVNQNTVAKNTETQKLQPKVVASKQNKKLRSNEVHYNKQKILQYNLDQSNSMPSEPLVEYIKYLNAGSGSKNQKLSSIVWLMVFLLTLFAAVFLFLMPADGVALDHFNF